MLPFQALNLVYIVGSFVVTGQHFWILTGCVHLAMGPYTAIVMGHGIEVLRGNRENTDDEDIYMVAKKWSDLHHARTVVGMIAFGISLYMM